MERKRQEKKEQVETSEVKRVAAGRDAEVWLPNVNEFDIPGYCMLDHIMVMPFDTVESDVPFWIEILTKTTKVRMVQS